MRLSLVVLSIEPESPFYYIIAASSLKLGSIILVDFLTILESLLCLNKEGYFLCPPAGIESLFH